ncbi:uncharacterized protein LOC132742258 [Ruditapes philippinarum]|uniref:uncharacterized protein LOC132742258 n=1 Tax=Ruditapes philippinarum TaxID=129788 RepID=UPI00295B081C|nr:uncharacterized protein LOC132742258 [Ruditapes philippinarum]
MDINLPMSPPVNNNIQSSLCDRLDAVVFEKMRVVNTQLDARLTLQEKIINKYRRDVEKIHARQTRKIKREVRQIRQKKPDYVCDDSDISTSRSQNTVGTSRQRCLSEPSNLSYCRRYYSHHFNVKEPEKEDKKDKDGKKQGPTDFFNMRMRLYFVNMMNNIRQRTHLHHDIPDDLSYTNRDRLDSNDLNLHSHFLPKLPHNANANYDIHEEKEICGAQQDEPNEEITIHSVKEEDDENVFNEDDQITDFGGMPVLAKTDIIHENPRDINANKSWDGNRRRHRSKGGKSRRRSILGSGSEEEVVYNETERRKAKHAFEKIFAGLL